ncbi:MAG: glutamine--tRNA ligase/YqeY domain fusion protein [Vulcanimicrobiota bacterium]
MSTVETSTNFIRQIIDADLASGKHRQVVTRFPPEPNGYLHIGHAKAICLNFGIARDYAGRCHLRFDDTNPLKEDTEYVEAIAEDIRWLGWDWGDHEYHASDYFDQLYEYAVGLIRSGHAYVDDLTADQIREYRGTLTEPGRESPYRNRSLEENLELFERMRAGEFEDGARVLRAKIDMASPNVVMRDPTLYRIRKAHHHRSGDKWCIYPMYDYTHCLSDAIEGITHSLCSLEFENNRPLYEWVLEKVGTACRPQQIEFSRLNLNYTVMSKRKLIQLVREKRVAGWDDPRMPTLRGMRRRGYTPEAIRDFVDRVGITKKTQWIELALLEDSVRNHLNTTTERVMGVLDPLKVVITNYPEGQVEQFEAPYYPDDPPAMGSREVPFTREIYIEREDFMEDPPKKFFRLAPGREVRLRRAYYITCNEVIKDEQGEIVELRCTYDPETRGGSSPDGRKVKGTIHWVSASHSLPAEVRLYSCLFTDARPDSADNWLDLIAEDSLVVRPEARVEPALTGTSPGNRYQFERQGYFVVDPDSNADKLVFNRIVPLRDSWTKIAKKL